MSSFLKDQLNILKEKNFLYPEMELRVLLNKSSISNKEIIFSNFQINQIDIDVFQKAFHRRINKEPVSKIFNEKNFWKYNFFVNQHVLDPRPETELIIEKVIKYFPKKNQKLKILDIGSGSGCLAISLAKEYCNAKIVATDISIKALEVAHINAEKYNCINQIEFINCNLAGELKFYDIIITNPPYLSELEYKKTDKEIQLFEPKIALVGGLDGLKFYRELSNILPQIMSFNSLVFVEIGCTQADKITQIFKRNEINYLEIVKDIQQLNRLLVLKK